MSSRLTTLSPHRLGEADSHDKQDADQPGPDAQLKAAREVSKSGCSVVIANGREPDVLPRIMRGDDVGTLILASAL